MKERVFSGMRPTGRLHFGNYFGALQRWVELQDQYDCIYCVVDLHALTTAYEDVSQIHEDGLQMVADWIGAGVDPQRSLIFRQSAIAEHSELALLLGMVTPKSWLERVPTYKGQIAELGSQIDTFGFFGYPVLQTADIALYKATKVPVGQDQLPHLELAREIVRRFNHLFASGSEVLPEPAEIMTEEPLLLGPDNRKMSKSYNNTIQMSDSPDQIAKAVTSMITDPEKIRRNDPGRPGICNVYSYDKLFATPSKRREEIERTCRSGELGCVEHKQELTERVVEFLRPMRKRREAAIADRGELERVLEDGADRAKEIAENTIAEVRSVMGL